jgi:hypothetical protein
MLRHISRPQNGAHISTEGKSVSSWYHRPVESHFLVNNRSCYNLKKNTKKINKNNIKKTHQAAIFLRDRFKYMDTDSLFFSTVEQNLHEYNKVSATSRGNITEL